MSHNMAQPKQGQDSEGRFLSQLDKAIAESTKHLSDEESNRKHEEFVKRATDRG